MICVIDYVAFYLVVSELFSFLDRNSRDDKMSLYRIPVQIYCESFLIAYSETGDERYLDYFVEDTLLKEEKNKLGIWGY